MGDESTIEIHGSGSENDERIQPTNYAAAASGVNGSASSGSTRNARRGTRTDEARDEAESASQSDSVKPTDYTEFVTTQKAPRKAATKASANSDALQVASLFVMLVSSAAQSLIGDYAAFNATESQMITNGVLRMLASGNKATLKKVQKFADPLALLMGFGMWGIRVSGEYQRRARMAAEHATDDSIQESVSSNGAVSTEDAHAQAVETVRNIMQNGEL